MKFRLFPARELTQIGPWPISACVQTSPRSVLSLLMVAAFALARPSATVAAEPARDWNVLLITLDTTRADFLGCYGRKNATTPNLDRLAAEGVLFEQAFSSNPVTQASHSTILT